MGESLGLRREALVVEDPRNEAHPLRFLSGNLPGGEHQVERPFRAHEARQDPGAAGIGDQADPGEGLLQEGAAGGDYQIAGQRDIGRSPDGGPVQGRRS